MKAVVFFFFLLGLPFVALGQEVEDYYQHPSQRKDVKNNAYPNLDRESMSLYVGLEGAIKLTQSTLGNTFDDLIGKQKSNDLYWGIVLGYNMDNRWSVETGYFQNPTYIVQLVKSGRSIPYVYRLGTALHTIPIRYKRKIWTIDPITKNAMIYVGAGVLVAPGGKHKSLPGRTFTGYSNSSPQKRDILELKSEVFLEKSSLAQAEVSVELHGRVSNTLSIVVFARGNAGAKGMVHSDLSYLVNSSLIDASQHNLNAISYNFGLIFRYNLAKGFKYKSKVDTE